MADRPLRLQPCRQKPIVMVSLNCSGNGSNAISVCDIGVFTCAGGDYKKVGKR